MISIIVPIYNVEDYLRPCVDSILNQTFTDYELILVDDGSTDSSGLICDQYAEQDNRIVVVHKENGGLSSARNAGLDKSKGDFILMIDGDDFIHPMMVMVLHSLIIRNDYDFAMCSHQDVNNKSSVDFVAWDNNSEPQILSQDDCMKNMHLYVDSDFNVVWNKLYSRRVIENCSFKKVMPEDVEFNTNVYQNVNKAIFLPVPLYYYVMRPGSIMRSPNLKWRHYNVILTAKLCLDNIPKELSAYRGYCLYRLYRLLVSRSYNSYGTDYYDFVQSNVLSIKDETYKEFLTIPHMSFVEKHLRVFLLDHPTLLKRVWDILIRVLSIVRKP